MRIQRASLLGSVSILMLLALVVPALPIVAQNSPAAFTDGDWPRYTRDLAGTRFSKNANTGEFAWQITLGVSDNLPPGKQNTQSAGGTLNVFALP